jgi:outer membrane protein insertion porin family
MIKKLFLVTAGCLLAGSAWGSAPRTVAVFPFAVHSQENLDYLGQGIADMLLTRMEEGAGIATVDKHTLRKALPPEGGALNERLVRELARSVGADYAITGSITKIGTGVSIDALIIDASGQQENRQVYVRCDGIEGVPEHVAQLARQLDLTILDKQIIGRIDIRGNRYIEKDAIILVLKSKEGDLYSSEALQEDLRLVYGMGYFSDVRIESEDAPEGKLVTFIVAERPVVSQIKIQGNKQIKTPDIQKTLGVKLGRVLDQNQVRKDAEGIRKLYTDKGYLSAEIEYKLTPSGEGETSVDYYIRENEISKIKKITFVGNTNIKSKQLRGIMETRQKNFLSFITSAGIFKEEALQKDVEKLMAYYYYQGYIKATVSNPAVTHEGKDIFITIPVEEGDRYNIGTVDLTGDLILPRESLAKDLQAIEGKVFSSNYLNKDMVNLRELYADKGYANVDISPLTSIHDEQKTVDITYDIAQGEKVYFETINITGNNRTRDKVIRREVRVAEGDLYSTGKIKRSQQELENLGYFKKVNLTTAAGSSSSKLNLNVEVEEKPTGSISFGAGYSSVDSLVGMIQFSQENFRGKGQRFDVSAQLGGTNRFMLSFTEPWFRDTRWSAGFDLYNMERWYEDFDSESTGGGIRVGHPVGEYTKFNFGYEYETVDVTNVDEDAAIEIIEQEGSTTVGAFNAGIIRNTLDNRFTPRKGTLNSLTGKFAGLGGDSSFVTLEARSSRYFPLPWETAFMIRGTIGYIFGYGGDDIPIFEKFFLGGLDSLRGFEERSVGPRVRRGDYNRFITDPNDYDVVGGEKELFFNFEYIFPIVKSAGIRGDIFFDTGNAYRQSEGYLSDMRESVGAGIRWQSPFGPLRVEWGLNLSPKEDEDSSQIHFTMGTMF